MRLQHTTVRLFHFLQHLRDPLVQVWFMAGISVLLVLIGHLRAIQSTGEGKNETNTSPSRLLIAGATVTWTEDFGPAHRETRRPVLALNAPAPAADRLAAHTAASKPMDVRPVMQEAASRPLKFLDRPLRQALTSAPKASAALKVHLTFSGATRGNAALISLQSRPASAVAAARFVIGNGSRSGDGTISLISPPHSLESGLVEIILVGKPGAPTPAQTAAPGALPNLLEAISGHSLQPDGAPASQNLAIL